MALFRRAFTAGHLLLPPPVLSEALSDPALPVEKAARIRAIPLLELRRGYWERAGMIRAWLKRQGYKGVLADCLIAQACIDSKVPLITYDRDFRHFVSAGLELA
jgi:predicted nucleic acid-binding protein